MLIVGLMENKGRQLVLQRCGETMTIERLMLASCLTGERKGIADVCRYRDASTAYVAWGIADERKTPEMANAAR